MNPKAYTFTLTYDAFGWFQAVNRWQNVLQVPEEVNAVQLSQEADKLRRELSEQDESSSQSERPKEGADRLQEQEQAALERTREALENLQNQGEPALSPQQSPFGYEV